MTNPASSALPGVGPATVCAVTTAHQPPPVRFIWHHVQPKEAGGATAGDNLVQLCDNCHYTIHRLMWYLRLQALDPARLSQLNLDFLARPPRRTQLAYAQKGYAACQAAGTVDRIPNEG